MYACTKPHASHTEVADQHKHAPSHPLWMKQSLNRGQANATDPAQPRTDRWTTHGTRPAANSPHHRSPGDHAGRQPHEEWTNLGHGESADPDRAQPDARQVLHDPTRAASATANTAGDTNGEHRAPRQRRPPGMENRSRSRARRPRRRDLSG